MDVEVTVAAGKPPRAARPYRLVEAAGLVGLCWGLASGAWLLALASAALIAATYALYRQRHGTDTGSGTASDSDDGGGGD
jgi:hypothetical protein